MKECKQCSCNLPDDYDLDICPVCLDDMDGLIPDSVRGLDEDEIVVKQTGQLYGTEKEPNPKAGRIYDAEGLSPTLLTCSGGNSMPIVATYEMDDIDEFLNGD